MRGFILALLFVIPLIFFCQKDWGAYPSANYEEIAPPPLPPEETVYIYSSSDVVYALHVHTYQHWIKLGASVKIAAKVFKFKLNEDNSLSDQTEISSYTNFSWKFQEVKWVDVPVNSNATTMAEYGGRINGREEISMSLSAWQAEINMPEKEQIDYYQLIELKEIAQFPVEISINYETADESFEMNLKRTVDLTFYRDFTVSSE